MTAAPKRRRPTIRRVADDDKPVPVDLTGCIIKWLLIVIVVVVGCSALSLLVFVGGPVLLALIGIGYYNLSEGFVPLPAPTAATAADTGEWFLSEDSTTTAISLWAIYDVESASLSARPQIVIKCERGVFDASIDFGITLAEGSPGKIDAVVRYDTGTRTLKPMLLSEDRTVVSSQESAGLVGEMRAHEFVGDRMYVTVARYDGTNVEAEFEIRGLANSDQPVFDACK